MSTPEDQPVEGAPVAEQQEAVPSVQDVSDGTTQSSEPVAQDASSAEVQSEAAANGGEYNNAEQYPAADGQQQQGEQYAGGEENKGDESADYSQGTKRKAEEENYGGEEDPSKKLKLDDGSSSVPPRGPGGGSDCTVFVGGLSFDAEDADIRQYFYACGPIIHVRIPLAADGRKKGIAFVEFATAEAAQHAMRTLDSTVHMGRRLEVRPAHQQGAPGSGPRQSSGGSFSRGDKPSQCKTIFVGNLPFTATEDDLQQFFSQCGPINSVRITRDRETNRPRGFGHVEFENEESVDQAMRMAGQEIQGRAIRVDYAGGKGSGGGGGGSRSSSGSSGGSRGGSGYGGAGGYGASAWGQTPAAGAYAGYPGYGQYPGYAGYGQYPGYAAPAAAGYAGYAAYGYPGYGYPAAAGYGSAYPGYPAAGADPYAAYAQSGWDASGAASAAAAGSAAAPSQ